VTGSFPITVTATDSNSCAGTGTTYTLVIVCQTITVTDPAMTRFMMTLEDAVELVMYAFHHGASGDIFVQKAPAATIAVLTQALREVLGRPGHEVREIGTRHGEKLYETLLTREELARAEDLGSYYRIPADTRDLNYNLYFTEGGVEVSRQEDYHSHNTRRLVEDELIELLLKLDYVQQELKGWRA